MRNSSLKVNFEYQLYTCIHYVREYLELKSQVTGLEEEKKQVKGQYLMEKQG